MDEVPPVQSTPQPAVQTPTAPQIPVAPQANSSLDTKSIVTILLLLFFFPLGVILMWFLTKWPVWLKLIITIPVTLAIIGILAVAILAAVNPKAQIQKANEAACRQQCSISAPSNPNCYNLCLQEKTLK